MLVLIMVVFEVLVMIIVAEVLWLLVVALSGGCGVIKIALNPPA